MLEWRARGGGWARGEIASWNGQHGRKRTAAEASRGWGVWAGTEWERKARRGEAGVVGS